ncbi:hypothetical protein HN873_024188 [Arachis hypogaea]
MEPLVGNKFCIGRKICGVSFGEIYLEIVIIRRGSCGGKGEEKGGGGTNRQGHSSEAETHDQESVARSRERKQLLEFVIPVSSCENWYRRSIFFIDSVMLLEMDLSFSCTVAKISGTSALQIALCKEMVQWTRVEKRTFLRQRVEARLAVLLMENKEFSEVLTLLSNLIKEVRRLDDKLLLVDIDLLESKLHFSLRNLPKAKNALTAARTAANAIYVPPA